MDKDSRIYIAGHRGLAGSAILRKLRGSGYENLVYKSHSFENLPIQTET
jgi:GDP-L-fucose synthase